MPLSTEAFKDKNGDIRWFTALFCEWMTEIFSITFKPAALYEWIRLLMRGFWRANPRRRSSGGSCLCRTYGYH